MPEAEVMLAVENLSKSFGGLFAVNGVSLRCLKGQVHAVIGPNGAGKSTFINLISGHLRPSSGRITFKGRDIGGLPVHRVTRLGLGRSYQKTNIFLGHSCFQNVWLAAQSRLPSSMRFLRRAGAYRHIRDKAHWALEQCGLGRERDVLTANMSHGQQRALEVAMVLATEPEFLALDEPMAGMGKEESDRMVDLLKGLSKDYTLLLVEHDMDAVFALADVMTVMVNGSVLESGPLEQVRSSPAVQEAYLGEGAEA